MDYPLYDNHEKKASCNESG